MALVHLHQWLVIQCPTIMIGKFIEIAHINEPIVKSTNATKNNFRYGYLLNRYAVIGIKNTVY